tara:strand:+ start:184 stop:1002 length:819 start_codon:yes stop_codon:yes gene_type:complete
MIKYALNFAGRLALHSRPVRSIVRYIHEWSNGFYYGSYSLDDEAALAMSFASKSSGGGVIIDAGANFGAYTQALNKSETPFKKILMIEPSPALNAQLNDLADQYPVIAFEAAAVGAEPGSLQLYSDREKSGIASLYQRDISHFGIEMNQSVWVPVVTLDLITSEYEIENIDYLKLDVEGHELEALKGAKRLLEEKRIRAIAFEFGGCNIDSRTYVKDFWSLLVKQYGFTFYRLAPGRRLIKLDRYSESLERFNWQNLLACAPCVEPTWKVID